MKKLFVILLIGGAAVVLLALQGVVHVPGITPDAAPSAEKLTPPKEDRDAKPPSEPKPSGSEGTPQAKRLDPAPPPPSAPAKPKSLYPPIKPEDVARARGFYEKGDFSNVQRSLDGCERPEVEESAATSAARTLFRKSRLLAALTKSIARSPLATPASLERVSLDSGGTVVGNVVDKGETLVIQLPGSVETSVTKDSVIERTKVGREVLDEKLRARLKERAAKVEGDDAIGNYRLGHYCWQYGMNADAVPYFDKAVEGSDFPVIARVFGGKDSDSLVDGWCELTGKPKPGEPVAKATPPVPKGTGTPPATPTTPLPPPKPGVAPSPSNDTFLLARKRYDEGIARYKVSFGDSSEALKALREARSLLGQARDHLQRIIDGGGGDNPEVEKLQTQIARLLYDCNKRSSIQ